MGPAAAAGAPFGRYVLKERLARGGMGEVFRAIAVGAGGFEKPVVVKRILPQLAGRELLESMFVEEARLMSRLAHPNIVQVIDFGQGEQGDYFLVMELVEGVDLGQLCDHFERRAEPVPIGLALYVLAQALRGLGHAHKSALGDGTVLVHRDVSPGNVLLSTVGEVKVADFGVALVGDGADAGTLVGKPSFMAPEQFRGEPVDGRADVFALGVVGFAMLTGELPFDGASSEARQANAAQGRLRDALALRPEIGAPLAAVLARALAAKADERFDSARAMVQAIEALRAQGYTIATADELATIVEALHAREKAAAKPVVALGADGGVYRELTRTTVPGQLTLRGTEVEEHSEVRNAARLRDETEAARPAERPPRRGLVLGGGVVLALLAALWLFGRERTETVPEPVAPAPPSAVPPASTAPALARPPPQPSSLRAERGEPSASAPPVRLPPQPTATVSVSPVRSAAPCEGTVVLASSTGSWWVSGGPRRVQAPGQYTWPCGSYALSAISRQDDRQSSASVTVRDGAAARAEFR